MSGKRILVKIGGSTLGQEDTTLEDLVELQGEGHQPVVVHGGGKSITEWLERIQVPTRFVNGVRVTDEASIDVVVAVLAGVTNKRLVAAVNAAGGRAVGLSGVDAAAVRAHIKDKELGLVGEVERVDASYLESVLGQGMMPVIAPIGVLAHQGRPTATLLNINADTMAAEIGAALKADEFIFLTDVPGVLGPDGGVCGRLTPQQVRQLVASETIVGGMIPKVEACLHALSGVRSSLILDGGRPHVLRDAMAGEPLGTRIE